MADPRVTIVLPTWNGAPDLARLLPCLQDQRLAGGFEIRAVDSGSTDGTLELLRDAGVKLARIAKADFSHGRTRNLAARKARSELVVFLSQDALPASSLFLANLAAPFTDSGVAGSWGRVLPHQDDDPLTARTVIEGPDASPLARTSDLDGRGALSSLPPRDRARLCGFNDVASCIRRSVLQTIPFPDVRFGEDSAWAAAALDAGWRLRFVPEAIVFHSHRYSLRAAYERYRTDARFQREVHGFRVRPSLWSLARGLAHEVRQDVRYVRMHGGALHLLRSPFLRAAQVLGQYSGTRD